MSYWVNIYHPPVEGESCRNRCKVYLQQKNEHLIDEFSEGDDVFIYETKNLSWHQVERGRALPSSKQAYSTNQ